MAELYVIGNIDNATDFFEPQLFIKWSIQCGTTWKIIEGVNEGQTPIDSCCFGEISNFSHPIDLHLACRGLQGWPKIHIEVYAVNALKKYWPVGFGFAHIPTHPGNHKISIPTWKIAPGTFIDSIRDKFHGGGFAISKSDLVFSGVERFVELCNFFSFKIHNQINKNIYRYKLFTKTSGTVNIELMLIFKNFAKYGVEF